MIVGAHAIIYSRNPDADRAFLRDVFGLPHVDVGGGWLIFGLPPAELAVHPSEKNDVHELYLMCDNLEKFIQEMRKQTIPCDPVRNEGWGMLTQIRLPGGGKVGVYQPRHPRPKVMKATRPKAKAKPKPKAKPKTRARTKRKGKR